MERATGGRDVAAGRRLPGRVSLYTRSVTLLGILIAIGAVARLPSDRLGLLVFALLAAIAEVSNVELYTSSRSNVSVSSIIALASILLFGPLAGALVFLAAGVTTILSSLRQETIEETRASWFQRTAFNSGMYVIAAAVAGTVYMVAGGVPGVVARPGNIPALILAATADTATNLLLLIGVITLQTGQSPLQIWNKNFRWAAPLAIGAGILGGGALALAYEMFHLLGLAVFLLPVLATGYSFRLYVDKTREYVDQIERTLAHLRKSEERYALATRGANDGLWDWDLRSGEIFFSTRWKEMLGYSEEQFDDDIVNWFELIHKEERERFRLALDTHLEGESPHFEVEHRMRHRDGNYRWMLTRGLAVRDLNGAYRMSGSQADITERKRAEHQLLHDAFHDGLTHLPNRALLLDRLSTAISRTQRREEYGFALLFLDIDRFKVINDSLGHPIGDELLIALARQLAACVQPGDTVARLGGDEFTILLDDISDPRDAMRFAERIQAALKLPFYLNGYEVYVTCSIGIVLSDVGYERPEDALRDADIAMYRAKSQGAMRYAVFDTQLRAQSVALLQLETDLRRAIEHDQLALLFQPIVSLESGALTGFEALVRWNHPEHGSIPPSRFIPVAEETGMIIHIDQWVLERACRQLREWQETIPGCPALTMSVNLSSKHFTQPDLVQRIDRTLRESGLGAHFLRLEVTESSIIENTDASIARLSLLAARGVRLSIDDFGTGYSSLSYLHSFPFDNLKVDRSFVGRMGIDGDNAQIVRTITSLAHDLNMEVTAEGIETREQLAQLKSIGCEFGQGFLFARPMDAAAARALIADFPVAGAPLDVPPASPKRSL